MKLLASLLVLGLAQNEQPDIHSFLGGLSAEERQALQFLLSEPAAPARAPVSGQTGLASRARPGPGELAPGPLPSDNARNNLASPGQVALASLHNTAQADEEFGTDDGKARPSSSWRPTGQSGQNYGNNRPVNNGNNYNNNNNNYGNNNNRPVNSNQPYNQKPNQQTNSNYNQQQNRPINSNYNQQQNRPNNSNYNQQQNRPTNQPQQPYQQPNRPNDNHPYNQVQATNNYNKPTNKPNKPYSTTKPRPNTTIRDANECFLGTDNCHPNASCINLKYGFKCTCKSGFVGDGVYCDPVAVDECATGEAKCDANAICINLIDGYDCRCKLDYTGDGYKCDPKPVDECATGKHNCSPYAECIDKNWGFKCKCNKGYEGDGVSCTSTDPCANADCTPNKATCNNGKCTCKPGFSGNGIGVLGCYDFNECTNNAHNCDINATCVNSPGSFVCVCQSGYTGDGTSCTSNSGGNPYFPVDEYETTTTSTTSYTTTTSTMETIDFPYGNTNNNNNDNPYGISGSNTPQNYNNNQNNQNYNNNNNGNSNGGGYATPKPTTKSTTTTKSTVPLTFTYPSSVPYVPTPSPATTKSTGYDDPCAGPNNCDSNSQCVWTSGVNYVCKCLSGYTVMNNACRDINECAPCVNPNDCPCSDPTPICSNTPGSFTCGVNSAFGDPHFRVTAPGQEPICFDVDTKSENILSLIADGSGALEVNAQFKNVNNARKQFIKTIGFTSPEGVQLMMTPDAVEVYEKGVLIKSVNLTRDSLDERYFDIHLIIWPALTHNSHQTRHVVTVNCDSGPRFKFSVKPGAGSLALEVESITGIASPVGLIGQFFNSGAYAFDAVGNIVTGTVHIPSDDKQWHKEDNCHQIKAEHVPAFLGHEIDDYVTRNIFSRLFRRIPFKNLLEATFIESEKSDEYDPK